MTRMTRPVYNNNSKRVRCNNNEKY